MATYLRRTGKTTRLDGSTRGAGAIPGLSSSASVAGGGTAASGFYVGE